MMEYKEILLRCIKNPSRNKDEYLERAFFKTILGFEYEDCSEGYYGDGKDVIRQLLDSGLEQVRYEQHVYEKGCSARKFYIAYRIYDIVDEYTFKYQDYSIIFKKYRCKGLRPIFAVLLSLPNQKVYDITGKFKNDGIVPYIYSLEKWDVYASEWERAQEFINKSRKKLEIGKSTISMMLENILNENKWEYVLYTEYYATTLKIKMRYHRCIEIKLTPSMDMAKLTQITEMVKTVTNAMNAVGNINLTVKNYGSDVKWKSTKGNVDADE